MKKVLKGLIKQLIKRGMAFMLKIATMSRPGRYLFDSMLHATMQHTQTVRHHGVELAFAVPNGLSLARATSFSTKEPETLEWIDSMEQGSVVWDIGANVGLYSCYAAKRSGCTVYAFEPSVFNLELLARNIFLNNLTGKVTIVPLPLSDHRATSTLNMSMTDWGGSMSTFSESYTHDGTSLNKVFEFRTIGFSLDDAISHLCIAQPNYIKIDVDGIEHLILKGGVMALAKVKSVLIEVNDEFAKQSVDSFRYLCEAGLELLEKRHSAMFAGTSVYNQVWRRRVAV